MIIKPVSRLVQEIDAKAVTVVGAPCADGLGVEALETFHAALAGAEGDVVVVTGGVAPRGISPFYRSAIDFIDRVSPVPVHVMPGSLDGPDFVEYFGYRNRAVLSEHFTLIMLDNSGRRFAPETLAFLRETLAIADTRAIIVAFHYPPPNRVSGNTMGTDEWKEFEDAVGVWRKRISLFLAGHEHSYYEDDIDGIRLVVSGGGGAKLARLDRVRPPVHHAVEIGLDQNGLPIPAQRPVGPGDIRRPPEVAAVLRTIYNEVSKHHVEMRLRGEEACRTALPRLGMLYHAISESFLREVRIFRLFLAPDNPGAIGAEPFARIGTGPFPDDDAIYETLRRANDEVLTRAVKGVIDTETAAKTLLAEAERQLRESGGGDLDERNYFVCESCAMLFTRDAPPEFCPNCGAPDRFIREIPRCCNQGT